ncbi:hypothetical protein PRIPAC_76022 [Pristionchus pacificus]|uniref:Uncharacterized protein n=1 Tax=Pristionchus pacificus TaxID=54126 RepID=A0A2A6CSS0_PRIPA|nr:hypothetical protein PRIPAC_76022 [Pristionchus pacificus]|eukprot:PDM81262.1 hypothetical protein PRIPAC_36265 [Pristionchus pacificus]
MRIQNQRYITRFNVDAARAINDEWMTVSTTNLESPPLNLLSMPTRISPFDPRRVPEKMSATEAERGNLPVGTACKTQPHLGDTWVRSKWLTPFTAIVEMEPRRGAALNMCGSVCDSITTIEMFDLCQLLSDSQLT